MDLKQKPVTILVVDDDCGLLRLVEKSLRRENFSVATADSGEAASACCRPGLSESTSSLVLIPSMSWWRSD